MMLYKNKTNILRKVKPGFFTLAYHSVFERFQIDFHAELKNEIFV